MNKTLKWILIGLAIAVGVFLLALPVFYLLRVGGGVTNLGQGMMPFRAGTASEVIGCFGGLLASAIPKATHARNGRATLTPPRSSRHRSHPLR